MQKQKIEMDKEKQETEERIAIEKNEWLQKKKEKKLLFQGERE